MEGMMFGDGALQLPPGVGEIIPGVLYVGPHTACERMVSDFGIRYVVECLSDDERRNLHEQRYNPLLKNLDYSKQVLAALSEAVDCCLEAGPQPTIRDSKKKPIENNSRGHSESTTAGATSAADLLKSDDVAALKSARATLLKEFGKQPSTSTSAWDQLGEADAKTTEAPQDITLEWTKTKQQYLNGILDKAMTASMIRRDAGAHVPPHTAKLIDCIGRYQKLVAAAVSDEAGGGNNAGSDEEDDNDGGQNRRHVDPTSASSPSKAPEGLVEDPLPASVPIPPLPTTTAATLSPEDEEALWRGYRLTYPPQVRVVTVPMEDSLTEDIVLALNNQKPLQPFQHVGIGNERVPKDGVAANATTVPTHAYRHRWSVVVGTDGKQRLVPGSNSNNKAAAFTEDDLIDEVDGHTKAHNIAKEQQHRQGLDHIGTPIVTRPEALPMPLPIVSLLDEILCQNPSLPYLEELSTAAMTKMMAKKREEQDAALGYQSGSAASKVTELEDGEENETAASPISVPVFQRHAVFIHCYAGKSRSPAITAAYVMLSQYLAARTSDAGNVRDILSTMINKDEKEGEEGKDRMAAFDRRGPYFANPPLHSLEDIMELLCHCGPLTVTRGFNIPSVPEDKVDGEEEEEEKQHTAHNVDPNSIAEIVLEESAIEAVHGTCVATQKQYETLVSLQQQLLEAKIQRNNANTDATDNDVVVQATTKKNDTGLNEDTVLPVEKEEEKQEEVECDEEEEAAKTEEEELLEMQNTVNKSMRQSKVLSEFLKQIKDAHLYNRKTLGNLRKDYEGSYIDRHVTPSALRGDTSEGGGSMGGLGAPGTKMSFGRLVSKGRGVRPNPKLIRDLLGLENAVMLAHTRVQEFLDFSNVLKDGKVFSAEQLAEISASSNEAEEPYATAFDEDDYNLEGLLDLFVRGESGNMISTLTEPEVYKIFMSPEVDRDVVKARRVLTKEHAKKLFSTTSRRRQMAEAISSLLNEDEEHRVANEKKAAKEEALASKGASKDTNSTLHKFYSNGLQVMVAPETVVEILARVKDDFQAALMEGMVFKKKKLQELVEADLNNSNNK